MFIAFEGIDGSGKSTQIKLFAEYLRSKSIDTFLTVEPGGTDSSEMINTIVRKFDIPKESRLLLFIADRIIHIKKIEEKLNEGRWVLTDRYSYSTLAYQGYGEGIAIKVIDDLLQRFCPLMPEVTFLLNISPESAINRIYTGDVIEKKGYDFYRRVRNGYLELAKRDKRVLIIDASGDIQQVHKKIIEKWENEVKRIKSGISA